MGHSIEFELARNYEALLSTDEVEDFVNLFYRWNDTKFLIIGRDENPFRRGSHIYVHSERTHRITLSAAAIIRGVDGRMRMGGSGPAPTARVGIAMVLTHELQHANQAGQHLATERFYTHRDYNSRPCEREARAFVDSHMTEILTLVAPELLRVKLPQTALCADHDEVEDVLEVLQGLSEVSLTDIRTELRLSGISSPKNVQKIREILFGRGVKVTME